MRLGPFKLGGNDYGGVSTQIEFGKSYIWEFLLATHYILKENGSHSS